jgi:hypothetical protein
MSITFKPNGSLNIATAPTDLPEDAGEGSIVSEAMARCKNLRVDRQGVMKARDGVSVVASLDKEHSLPLEGKSVIVYSPYNSTTESVFEIDGRLRWEGSTSYNWGIEAPTVAPTLALITGDATLTGDYTYQYTYVRKEDTTIVCESNPSPASSEVSPATQDIRVTWTAPTDAQVTHIRFYRTTGTGAIYYYAGEAEVADTEFDDNTADTGLGSQVVITRNRPPAGSYVAGPNYNGICFIVKDNNLYFSLTKQPEYWPVAYFIEVSPPDDPGVCVVFFNGQPYFLTTHRIYHIQGTGATTFFPFDMKAITGTQSKHGALAVKGHGIYHVGPDGVYLYSGQDSKITQNAFDPIFRGETVGGIPGVQDLSDCWLKQWRNQVYFCYDEQNVIVFNLDNNRATYYNYPYTLQYATVDRSNDRLLGSNGTTYYKLEDRTATQDGSTDIAWELRSKDYTLQTRAHFPRWVKYDIDASSSTSCTGTLYLDDVAHQTHEITGSRTTKRRLVTTGNGQRCAMGLSGAGPVSIYAVESE